MSKFITGCSLYNTELTLERKDQPFDETLRKI